MKTYLPTLMRVDKVTVESDDQSLKTIRLAFADQDEAASFRYLPGQFAELMVAGVGEAPFGIASSPTEGGWLDFSINRVGAVTSALHMLEPGDAVGLRGPLGNHYPIDVFRGKDVVIVGGGFAFTTLRALTAYMLHPKNRGDYGQITVIYGARRPGLLLYRDELAQWCERDDLDLHLTVDRGDDDWQGRVGFVPAVTKEVAPSSRDAYAVLCGPPIMIKFTLPVLLELGFSPESIYTSLEMKMKCGVGMCGRCNIGSKYVCKDGPIFTQAQLQELPGEY